MEEEPKLVSRRDHKKSTFMLGRTIGEKRERLETRNERAAARKKDKQKKTLRLIFAIVGFVALIIILVILAKTFLESKRETPEVEPVVTPTDVIDNPTPTIDIVDESASATGGKITNRMRDYIGQLEADLKSYSITPIRAVIPRDAIREVDFYLEGYSGYIKTVIDRGAGVTAEDADRMLRYLAGQGITDFEYIDVRIDGRAFWK